MAVKPIIIGTRGSKLALWQAEFIRDKLASVTERPLELKVIKTTGDEIDHLAFDQMEGKGFFTKEIEEALLKGEIDLAVHSLKDLMTTLPDGLHLPAVGFREDNRETLLVRREAFDSARRLPVKRNGVIGSSSVRRQCQIARLAPDLKIENLRGNVPTRINKLRAGQYDAVVVACAGLLRLGIDLSDLEMIILDKDLILPAPGQGMLAVQTCRDNHEINAIVGRLDDPIARLQMRLERDLLARFQGGCHLPLGAYSEIDGDRMQLTAVLGVRENDLWTDLRRAQATGNDPEAVIAETFRLLTG